MINNCIVYVSLSKHTIQKTEGVGQLNRELQAHPLVVSVVLTAMMNLRDLGGVLWNITERKVRSVHSMM